MANLIEDYAGKPAAVIEAIRKLTIFAMLSVGRAYASGLGTSPTWQYANLHRDGRLLGATGVITLVAFVHALIVSYFHGAMREGEPIQTLGAGLSMLGGNAPDSFFVSVIPTLILGALFTWLIGSATSKIGGQQVEGARLFAAYFFVILWLCGLIHNLLLPEIPLSVAIEWGIRNDGMYMRNVLAWVALLPFFLFGTMAWAGVLQDSLKPKFKLPLMPRGLSWTIAPILTVFLGQSIGWGLYAVKSVIEEITKERVEIRTPHLDSYLARCGSDGTGGIRCHALAELTGKGVGVFLSQPFVRWVARTSGGVKIGSIQDAETFPKFDDANPLLIKAGDYLVLSLHLKKSSWCVVLREGSLQSFFEEKHRRNSNAFRFSMDIPMWLIHPQKGASYNNEPEEILVAFDPHPDQIRADRSNCSEEQWHNAPVIQCRTTAF